MLVPKRNKNGFILIEIMIGIASVAIFSLCFALLIGICNTLQFKAKKNLEATTYAQNILEQLYANKGYKPISGKEYSVTVQTNKPFENNFVLGSVTISWDQDNQITLQGGWLE